MRIRSALAAAAVALSLGQPARAATRPTPPPTPPPAPSDGDCLECHEDASLVREAGGSVAVDAKLLAASVHGDAGLNCVDCHKDLATTTDFPHAARLAPVACGTCHEDVASEYQKSIHARGRADGVGDAATCKDCHGAHDILPPKDPESRTNDFKIPTTCGRCHGDAALIARNKLAIGDTFHQYQDSIHGQALTRSGLVVAPDCSDCHGTHNIVESAEPTSPVNKANVPRTCGKCHVGIDRLYEKSVHGLELARGNAAAPGCADCHSAHQIRRTDLPNWKLQVLGECGGCHEGYNESYRDTFHGQVTSLGFTRIATCADCHGSHDILPSEDPASRVSGDGRVKACQKCHEKANANFALYDPHADPADPERSALVYYTSLFMRWLLAGVFSFFGLHTVLWLVRSLIELRKGSQHT